MRRLRAPLIVSALAALVASAAASTGPGVVLLDVPGRADATPSIAADGNRVAIAWGARAEGGTDVFVAVSQDAGATFGAPVRVSGAPGNARLGGELPPRVAIAGNRVDLVWTARNPATSIVHARSTDGGRTFDAPVALQRTGAAGDRGWPAMAADRSGVVHAAWLDHRGAAGTHHATPDKSSLVYSRGQGEVEITNNVCYCCKTAIAATDDGRVFAAWRHVYPGNLRDIAFTVSPDAGRSFAPPVRVSADQWQLDGCPDDGPAVAVDRSRAVHIVWPTVVPAPEPHKAIFYSRTEDGRSFAKRELITQVGVNTAHPWIVAHPQGITVLWDELVDGRRRVMTRMRGGDGTLRAPVALTDGAVPATYPVAVAAGGGLVAAWVQGGGNDSVIAVRRIGSAEGGASLR